MFKSFNLLGSKSILRTSSRILTIALILFVSSCSEKESDAIVPAPQKSSSNAELPGVIVIGHNPINYAAIVQDYDTNGNTYSGSSGGGGTGGGGGGGGGTGNTGGTSADNGSNNEQIPPKTVFVYRVPGDLVTDVEVTGVINDGVLTEVTANLTGLTLGREFVVTRTDIYCGGGSCGGVYSYMIYYRTDITHPTTGVITTGNVARAYGTYNPVTRIATLVNP